MVSVEKGRSHLIKIVITYLFIVDELENVTQAWQAGPETRTKTRTRKSFFIGVAGRLVKSEKEAEWLEAEKVTEVQVNIH